MGEQMAGECGRTARVSSRDTRFAPTAIVNRIDGEFPAVGNAPLTEIDFPLLIFQPVHRFTRTIRHRVTQ